jgi:hypothetical protein
MARRTRRRRIGKVTLVASREAKPAIRVTPGMKLEVVSVALVDPAGKKVRPLGARLCGGTSTCLALVEL